MTDQTNNTGVSVVLTSDEFIYLDTYRERKAQRQTAKSEYEPGHCASGPLSIGSAKWDLVTDNDPAAHGFDVGDVQSFQCAWYVLGTLIRGQHYVIDFLDPAWPLKLRYTIEALDIALQQTRDWLP